MSSEEARLARLWRETDGESVPEIARRLHRNESSIWDLFGTPKDAPRGVGRHPALTEEDKDRLVALVTKMVKTADTRYTVTIDMIKKAFRKKVCVRVLANALHAHNVWFHRLREKPILTDDDVKARYAFARKYRNKSAAWWRTAVQLHIDNHAFHVPTTGAARRTLAARRVYGAYRAPGRLLQKEHVKQKRNLRQNTGAKHVLVAGGVGAGKVLLWHVVEKWNADAAAKLYAGPIRTALKNSYPGKRSWQMLEDNDPSGYQTAKGRAAKAAAKITSFEIPKRNPDLNVMDYHFWSEIETRLRKQERRWPDGRKETREQFKARLRRVAKGFTATHVNKAMGDMKWRVSQLYKAKGGLFEEGAAR